MTRTVDTPPIAISLTEAGAVPAGGEGVSPTTLEEWQELAGALVGFFTGRGYKVSLQSFSVAAGSRSLVANAYRE